MGNKEKETDVISTVDPNALNMENIKGLIVGLSPREVIWAPSSGNLDLQLSRLSGRISLRVTGSVSNFDMMAVIKGVQSGRLVVLEKEIKAEPATPMNTIPTADVIAARTLLDNQDVVEFENLIEKQPSRIVQHCLDLEKREGNRKEYLDIIRKVLSR